MGEKQKCFESIDKSRKIDLQRA